MKSLYKLLFIIVTTIVITNCSDDDGTSVAEIQPLSVTESYTDLNVKYGEDAKQTYDVYLPANRTASTKTLVLLHGGGWISGDKDDMNPIVDLIRDNLPDYAILNINYRLATTTNLPFPMQINDISQAINYFNSQQDYYKVSDKLGLIGTSAGGQLGLLWTYAHDTNNQVDMVCSIVGTTNFTDDAYLNSTNPTLQLIVALLGSSTDNNYLIENSPIHQVTATAPPTILFYGGQDELVPLSQGIDMRDKLVDLRVTHQFTLYENEGHGWEGEALTDTWNKLKLFIEEHLQN